MPEFRKLFAKLGPQAPGSEAHTAINEFPITPLPTLLETEIDERFANLQLALKDTPYARLLGPLSQYFTLYKNYLLPLILKTHSVNARALVFELVASGWNAPSDVAAIKTLFPHSLIRASDLNITSVQFTNRTWDDLSKIYPFEEFGQNVSIVQSDAANLRRTVPSANIISILGIGPTIEDTELPSLLFKSAVALSARGSLLIATAIEEDEIPLINNALKTNPGFQVLQEGKPSLQIGDRYIWIAQRVDYPRIRKPVTLRD